MHIHGTINFTDGTEKEMMSIPLVEPDRSIIMNWLKQTALNHEREWSSAVIVICNPELDG